MVEGVEHPSHYGGDTVYETIKVLEEKLSPQAFSGFLRGNATKYLDRAGKKSDSVEKDLSKAIFYINYEIDFWRRVQTGQYGEGRWSKEAAEKKLKEYGEFEGD